MRHFKNYVVLQYRRKRHQTIINRKGTGRRKIVQRDISEFDITTPRETKLKCNEFTFFSYRTILNVLNFYFTIKSSATYCILYIHNDFTRIQTQPKKSSIYTSFLAFESNSTKLQGLQQGVFESSFREINSLFVEFPKKTNFQKN